MAFKASWALINGLNITMFEINTILFDLFHTLVDVAAAPGATGRYTADILGVDREGWHNACFSDHHDICTPTEHTAVIRRIAHSIDPTIPESSIREAATERQRRFDYALTTVDAETVSFLRLLKGQGMRLGLLSNASTGEVSAWSRSPLAPLFDAALFSCESGTCKPELAFYRMALERLGAEPDRTLFVGDGGSNEHFGAKAAGLRTVLITRYLRRADATALAGRRRYADHEITHLSELRSLIG